GTYRLFTQIFQRFGIEFETFIPATLEDLDEKLAEHPKWLLFETPTNPLLEIFDIEAFSELDKRHGVITVVEQTFATSYYPNPLSLGADIVWHSTTKYIGGHSDIIGGVVMTNDSSFKEQMNFMRFSLGGNPSPFDAWLATRGVKTLGCRMEQHQKNAVAI